MARMKFLCDAERCIECNACVTACKNEHEVPWGVNRRRVVTIQDGKPGERSISVACMHCSDAPCTAVCPVDCFYQTDQGLFFTLKTYVSDVAIASMHVHLVHLSTRRPVITAHGARWTNVHSVQAALRKICLKWNSRNMDATDWPKANCLSVPRCVQPKRYWQVTETRSLTSSASVW